MPYLPIDLDGKKNTARVGNALGVHPGIVSWGQQEMWEFVWATKSDIVSDLVLDGFFGPDPRVRQYLVAYGFLEKTDTGYRVKGAKKWLFAMEGKSRGGHASKKNLIPGGAKPSTAEPLTQRDVGYAERVAEGVAETQPVGRPSALTPNTQHPNTFKKPAAKKAAAEKQTDPRHAPTVKALCEAFRQIRGSPYGFELNPGHNAAEVTTLLALAEPAEIERRWRRALAHVGFPTVAKFSELRLNWDHFAGTGPPAQKPLDLSRGMVRAQDVNKAEFGEPGVRNDF